MEFIFCNGFMTSSTKTNQVLRFDFSKGFFVLMLALLFMQASIAGPHPNMYLNQAEIDAIKAKVDAGIEPWASGYIDVISGVNSAANLALNQEPLSVTFQGRTSNQYYTENPRCGWTEVDGQEPDCRPGALNPAQDRGDYIAAIALGNAVRDLGLGYAFTGNAEYANKAIELIRVWSLDPETRMATDETAMKIELFITLPGVFYGADLIWNYAGEGGWVGNEKESFRSWVKKIADLTRERQISAINASNGTATNLNNFANWRNVLIASAGALLDDQGLLDYVEGAFKYLISVQMNGPGSSRPGILGQEYSRSQGLDYSLYAINAMMQVAEIMLHRGVNLYDYKDSALNTSMKLTLDFHTPFAIDPERWTNPPYNYTQSVPIDQDDNMALFELAHSRYEVGYENPYENTNPQFIPNGSSHYDTANPPSYLQAINRWGRPMDEIRVMGNITFTHANMFELSFEPVPANIISHPQAQSVSEGSPATFSVVASGSAPLTYQWYRNNDEITEATNNTYVLESVSADDNNVDFSVRVTNQFGTALSNNATLTVLLDNIAPTISSATVRNATTVDIRFSEALSTATAETIANYQISAGIQVLAAVLSEDQQTVQLQTDTLETETVYTVAISGIQDASSNANEIAPGSSIDIVFAPVMNFDNGALPFGWIPFTESRWSITSVNGNNALFLNTSSYNPESGLRLGEHITSPDSYTDFSFRVKAKTNESSGNPNADYAMVFGFVDEMNYYYMLFNRTTSNTQLSLVDGGVRQELATSSQSVVFDDEYHEVGVSRTGGIIEVSFDNNILFQVEDTTFPEGKLGLGSFNDSAYFDDIRITGASSSGQTNLILADGFE